MISPILIAGVVVTLIYVIMKIREKKLGTSDALFWFVFALLLLLMGLFPDALAAIASVFGVASSVNFIFIVICALLIYHQLKLSGQNSKMRDQIAELTHKIALIEDDAAMTRD